MSRLSSFLKANVGEVESTKDVTISERFSEPCKIKLLSPKEYSKVQDSSTKIVGRKPIFSTSAYSFELIKAALVEPDLKSSELQDSYGAMGEDELIDLMFTGVEFNNLLLEINNFNGLKKTDEERVEEAKN